MGAERDEALLRVADARARARGAAVLCPELREPAGCPESDRKSRPRAASSATRTLADRSRDFPPPPARRSYQQRSTRASTALSAAARLQRSHHVARRRAARRREALEARLHASASGAA